MSEKWSQKMQLTRFALSGGRGLFYISAWILLTESRQGRHRCSRQEMRIPSAVRRGIVGDSGVRTSGVLDVYNW